MFLQRSEQQRQRRRHGRLPDLGPVAAEVERFDRQGLAPFEILEGSIGSKAREIGGATLPLLANFSQDRDVLFKDAPAARASIGRSG